MHGESDGIVGYAAIKYTAIVIIVLAILAFLLFAMTMLCEDETCGERAHDCRR